MATVKTKTLKVRPVTGRKNKPAGEARGITPAAPRVVIPQPRSILDRKLIEDFCRLVLKGLPADGVCDFLGIHPTTYYLWLRKGEEFESGAGKPKEYAMYGEFVRAYRRAAAEYRLRTGTTLHRRGSKDWIRSITILERRDRRTWGRNEPEGGSDDQFSPDERFD